MTTSRLRSPLGGAVAAIASLSPVAFLGAQGVLAGTVVDRQAGAPLSAVRVSAPRLQVEAVSDSNGRFRLAPLPAGEHLVHVSRAGFMADSFLVSVGPNETVSRDILLLRAATRLTEVRVRGEPTASEVAKLVGFRERMKAGFGEFLDRAAIERWEGRRTGDMLALLPGLDVRRSLGSKAWAVGARAVSSGKCAFCSEDRKRVLDPADIEAGAGVACYADVYLDGALVYNSTSRGAPLFDLNSLLPESIAGVEYYAGPARLSVEFNRTSGGCGTLLIWTR